VNRRAILRCVRLENRVRQAVDDAIQKWIRTEIAWNAVEWTLIHEPNCGVPVHESGMFRAFAFDGAKSVGWPDIRVIYEVTKELIIIHDATFEDPKTHKAGHA
jgi:hypothetical protein